MLKKENSTKMKSSIFFKIFPGRLLLGLFCSCEEELTEITPIEAPTNLVVTATVAQDGSGIVVFNAEASGVMVYHFYPGVSPTERPVVSSTGDLEFAYRSSGDYTVNVVAYGPGGAAVGKRHGNK